MPPPVFAEHLQAWRTGSVFRPCARLSRCLKKTWDSKRYEWQGSANVETGGWHSNRRWRVVSSTVALSDLPTCCHLQKAKRRLRTVRTSARERGGVCGTGGEESRLFGENAEPLAPFKLDNALKQVLPPGLYVVPTPLGNLEDITLRALRVLSSVEAILAEDTRHTKKLLQRYNIKTPCISFHAFNEKQRQSMVLQRLQEGQAVGLVSDSGTPGISDPGVGLISAAAQANVNLHLLPGPCALVTALVGSGFSTTPFLFYGFLPAKRAARRSQLRVLSLQPATMVFYVPPHSLVPVLEDAAEIMGSDRMGCIARELTKLHEEFFRGSLSECLERCAGAQLKGEMCLVLSGASQSDEAAQGDLRHAEHALHEMMQQGMSVASAVKEVCSAHGVSKNAMYRIALELNAEAQKRK